MCRDLRHERVNLELWRPFTAHEIVTLFLKRYLGKLDLEKVSQTTENCKFSIFLFSIRVLNS